MTSYLSKLEPNGRANCLCGSGKRFKNCCKGEYSKKMFDGPNLIQQKEYKKALISIRSHIAWYRLCHMAHTVPFLNSKSDESIEMLDMDIEAMSEMLDLLLSCYKKCGMLDDYINALEDLAGAINDERWKIKIDYQKCVYFYVCKNERDQAKEILKLYDWKKVNDVDLLTVLIDVHSDDLNQVEKISIAERICDISSSPAIRLQYRNLIGIEYCLLNDLKKGLSIIESSIGEYEEIPLEDRTLIGRHHLALSYIHLGQLTEKEEYILTAIDNLKDEIATGEYSPSGEAQLWFDLGNCYYHVAEFDKATNAYNESLSRFHSGLTLVFQSRVLIRANNFSDARDMLDSVILDNLTPSNIFDFSISKCYLAIASKDPKDIQNGLELINRIETNDPMFMNLVQDLLLQLYELKYSNTENYKVESALQRFSRYVSLKPNFFGIGIDINAIIDDMGKRPSTMVVEKKLT